MTFAEKLKQLREKAGLTQAALARASGRSLGAVRDYEQGNREPTLKAAVKLSEALGVSVEVFAGCVGNDEDGLPPRGVAKKEAAGTAKAKKPRGRARKGK
jgi:transcriptional regulator with XRE-family HTH domain